MLENQIERGNDEIAFYLRRSGGKYASEITAAVSLEWMECPICHNSLLKNKPDSFREMLNHLRIHERNQFMNISFGICQQCVIIETNWDARGRHQSQKMNRKAVSIYKLTSEFGLDERLIADMFHTVAANVRNAAAKGLLIEKQDKIPVWMISIYEKIEKEREAFKC